MALAAQSKSPTSVNQKGSGINKRERTGFLRAFDWIIRPWHYFNTIPRAVAYLIAASGFYGGSLFVIGSFAGCSPAVRVGLAVAVRSMLLHSFPFWNYVPSAQVLRCRAGG